MTSTAMTKAAECDLIIESTLAHFSKLTRPHFRIQHLRASGELSSCCDLAITAPDARYCRHADQLPTVIIHANEKIYVVFSARGQRMSASHV